MDKDFIDISNKQPKDVLMDEIKKVHQEYTVRHEPFDARNALYALQNYDKQWTSDVQRAISNRQTPPKYKMTWDWNEYGKPERSEKISSSPVRDGNLKTGVAPGTLIGYNVDYRVKGEGNGVSVFVPIDVWNTRTKK